MKRMMGIVCVLAVLLSLAACDPPETDAPLPPVEEPAADTDMPAEEENAVKKIEIVVGNDTFSATLYDNAAAAALGKLLPMTLNMRELNGNEKYYYLESSLPADPTVPEGIRAGDLMLYGDSCIVLFYESFSTAYSYTPLGHIDDPAGLAAVLGNGGVEVTFLPA